MIYRLTLTTGVPGTKPITLEGDERTICIQAEDIIREMWERGRTVTLNAREANLKIIAYLNDVAAELSTWPGGVSKSVILSSMRPNQGNQGGSMAK
jgi:hypothetical protein